MRVAFLDRDGTQVKVSRTQYLRANHPEVTAYYMEAWTSFGGQIRRDLLTADAFAGTRRIPNHADVPPTRGNERLEITHVIENGMPFGLRNMLVPAFVLRWLIRLGYFPPFVVRRDLALTYQNEHTLADTYYQIVADRYIQKNVTVHVTFHPDRPPVLPNGVLKCQLIRRNGMETLAFNTGAQNGEFMYRFSRLRNEKVRIPFQFA